MNQLLNRLAMLVAAGALVTSGVAFAEERESQDAKVACPMSELINAPILDVSAEKHGKIIDLMVDCSSETAAFAVVECDQHPDKFVAVPMSELTLTQDEKGNRQIMLDAARIATFSTVPEGNWDAVYRIDLGGATKLTKEDDTHPHGLKRASDILACNVKNEEGKTVGEIEDLLVRSDGSIAYVEVSTGGFLGMGEDRHAVPLAALAPSDDKTVVLALDDLRLREAPRYPAGSRPDPYDTAFDRDLRTYYRVGHLDRIKGVGDGAVVKAGEVIGYPVKNSNGDKVGTLKDIVLDGQTGTIAFGVLSSGGFFGIADKLYAVPWERLRLDPFNQVMYLDTPKETLDRLPGFDDNDWPDFSEPEQRGAIARVFETAGPTAVPTATTVVKASEVLDRDVSAAGEEVGKIEELVLDAEQGKVKYAALLLEDEDDKMFAVDWKEIRVGAKDDQVVLNVSPSELKASRGFDKGRWPESAASRRDH